MLTLSRSWFRGLTVGLALGAVLGARTLSRGTSGRGDGTLVARVRPRPL